MYIRFSNVRDAYHIWGLEFINYTYITIHVAYGALSLKYITKGAFTSDKLGISAQSFNLPLTELFCVYDFRENLVHSIPIQFGHIDCIWIKCREQQHLKKRVNKQTRERRKRTQGKLCIERKGSIHENCKKTQPHQQQ